jgi:hypothetical protein
MSTPKRGLRIDPDGTVTEVTVDGLDSMQAVVGGLIELIQFHDGSMYVNEEGLLDGLPINPVASKLYGGYVVGSALCLGNGDRHGNDTHITKSFAARITATAESFADFLANNANV